MIDEMGGKLAIVTGGNRGIGLGIVKAFAAVGGRVALVASSPERGEAAAAELDMGEQVRGFGCDIADGEAVAALVDLIRKEMGEVDFLVNNYGVAEGGSWQSGTDEWIDIEHPYFQGLWETRAEYLTVLVQRRFRLGSPTSRSGPMASRYRPTGGSSTSPTTAPIRCIAIPSQRPARSGQGRASPWWTIRTA